jgi:hypothetical protein
MFELLLFVIPLAILAIFILVRRNRKTPIA